MAQKKYENIIWDWNGTLLNDVEFNISVMNEMLFKRGMPVLESVERYHEVFTFPVINYYKAVGFDFIKESYEDLAVEYNKIYHSNKSLPLHDNAEAVIKKLYKKNVRQAVLSATQHQKLTAQMGQYDIIKYFHAVLGISDIYASSKIEAGREYIKNLDKEKTVIIGDTLHDFDVANDLGIDCILFSGGHNAKKTLKKCNVLIIDNLTKVLDIV